MGDASVGGSDRAVFRRLEVVAGVQMPYAAGCCQVPDVSFGNKVARVKREAGALREHYSGTAPATVSEFETIPSVTALPMQHGTRGKTFVWHCLAFVQVQVPLASPETGLAAISSTAVMAFTS